MGDGRWSMGDGSMGLRGGSGSGSRGGSDGSGGSGSSGSSGRSSVVVRWLDGHSTTSGTGNGDGR